MLHQVVPHILYFFRLLLLKFRSYHYFNGTVTKACKPGQTKCIKRFGGKLSSGWPKASEGWPRLPGWGRWGTWVYVYWVCAAFLSEPLSSIIVYFLANYRPHLSHFLENVIFCDPNLVTFYLCIYIINVVSSGGM